MHLHLLQIVASLSGTVQEQQQRPRILLSVVLRQLEQVVHRNVDRSIQLLSLLLSRFGLLILGGCAPGVASSAVTQTIAGNKYFQRFILFLLVSSP